MYVAEFLLLKEKDRECCTKENPACGRITPTQQANCGRTCKLNTCTIENLPALPISIESIMLRLLVSLVKKTKEEVLGS
jgi:hypothetical protein